MPLKAKPVAKLAEVVVLPTPPLPDVTTTISCRFSHICSYRLHFMAISIPRIFILIKLS